jgi:lipopolysaccharide heptosyltransferase III
VRRLLIRPGGIGDCITCFPVMEQLRAGYTEVWVPSAVVPLVQFATRVRPIPSTGLDLVGIENVEAPRGTQFDEIVSWYGTNRPEFRNAVLSINPNWRFLPALPPPACTLNITDFYAQAAGVSRGICPRLNVPFEPKHASIVIQPFSGSPRKNWPLARFEDLARRLRAPVEWVAGPEESLAGAKRMDDLWELATYIARASGYIGNDSGITHLAAATGVPTIALFGETDPRVWAPKAENVTAVAGEGMQSITVERVLEAASTLLD